MRVSKGQSPLVALRRGEFKKQSSGSILEEGRPAIEGVPSFVTKNIPCRLYAAKNGLFRQAESAREMRAVCDIYGARYQSERT